MSPAGREVEEIAVAILDEPVHSRLGKLLAK